MTECLFDLLRIASPTYEEQAICEFISGWATKNMPTMDQIRVGDNLIMTHTQETGKPHLAFVGHSDVVPAYFDPFQEGDRIFGAGASDMKGGLAAFLTFVSTHIALLKSRFNVSIIVYCREEGTPLDKNGLYELIETNPKFFRSIDLAIIGEPTDNASQIGCLGSLHCTIKVPGKCAHSARPWTGENALYNALPLIKSVAQFKPKKQTVYGVEFVDVMSITESGSEPGRTSVPGYWSCNINYRFSPVHSPEEAVSCVLGVIRQAGMDPNLIQNMDMAPAGQVIETPLFNEIITKLGAPIAAKQAWTDVAQFSNLGIPSFNFGPGLQEQAHRSDEYILESQLLKFDQILTQLLD